jgi:dTDP-3-amino-2,3,6-trideoxy-4-keto-D-glucose/dTDP-3-amino-3,4,6-trideoxy-alpha-D-glucose/dTDP-2,6-dideoxy-D-kanosamine transaminase
MTNNPIKVPFFKDDVINVKDVLLEEIAAVLDSKQLILGEKVAQFESDFASYLKAEYCVGVANGTDALEIALLAAGIVRGSKVATVANAGFYTATATHAIGALPVFIEIDPDSFLMSVEDFEKKTSEEEINAVVVTHLYGMPAEIKKIKSIAKQKNIVVIEDCAQSHGLIIDGKFAGTYGDLSTFSFYPTKNLGALGDGGAVVTNSKNLKDKLIKLRQYGWGAKYQVDTQLGRNSRLDEIQAAVLSRKLKELDSHNQLRKSAVNLYKKELINTPIKFSSLINESINHLLPVLSEDRNKLVSFLTKEGIQTAIHYPIADHQQPAYSNQYSLPVTEKFCSSVLSLPLYPGIDESSIRYVLDKIKKFYEYI